MDSDRPAAAELIATNNSDLWRLSLVTVTNCALLHNKYLIQICAYLRRKGGGCTLTLHCTLDTMCYAMSPQQNPDGEIFTLQ